MAQRSSLNFLITGAGRGIGRGLTRLLLAKGHRVFLIDNNKTELDHLVSAHLAPSYPNTAFQASLTDLRNPTAIRDAVSHAAVFFDRRLDVLINNAALTGTVGHSAAEGQRFEDMSLDVWNASLETNLTAPMLLSQACVELLRRQGGAGWDGSGGTIIHMSSTRARQSEPLSEAYAATKAGLIGLTHAMAASLADDGITVNTILPGWINVAQECKRADEEGLKWEDELSEEDHKWHFTGRVGKVEDVLGAVEFLVRERFVNGTEIVLDGGVTRKMVYPE
ncbi:NAD(P)-binding protein [Cryphonectria parasitica EP155]|uniref:NAD(P)-binding protein n=1 Tax=Cryphonectria parasitica (strain ATCC 38755 / EP155) TaxID=660469 RepID=A0A9P4YB24_CRYP1|nr:NAD(P)-binding protein [Cryphonectria parasitica EP155]KAF3769739.1 NAD(P)-binding protein [Cryphonectria parasitica EP155]